MPRATSARPFPRGIAGTRQLAFQADEPSSRREPDTADSMHDDLPDLDAFLRAFDREESFAYLKINHGFWEALADVEFEMGWPKTDEERAQADEIARRPHFFLGGFVDEFLALLEASARSHPPSLHVCLELSAWPEDGRIIGTPFRPERSVPVLERYSAPFRRLANGLLLKQAVNDGTIGRFFERLGLYRVVLVGPEYLSPFFEFARVGDGEFIPIHSSRARETRDETESRIRTALGNATKPAVVLLQAGTLAPYWILRMHRRYPGVRWVDGGLAFSICHPPDILKRPWGKAYRADIVRTYNALSGAAALPVRNLFEGVSQAVGRAAASPDSTRPSLARVAFVEEKTPDLGRIEQLLRLPGEQNHWTNRGPLCRALAQAYHAYFGLGAERAVIPCANGGMALEAMARLHDARAGKRLRWVVSAFSFRNLGRGYFANAAVVDCDERGLLSLDELARIPASEYDGIVLTNPFGLCRDVDRYTVFADENDKALIVDNAGGGAKRYSLGRVPVVELASHQALWRGRGRPRRITCRGGGRVVPIARLRRVAARAHWKLAEQRQDFRGRVRLSPGPARARAGMGSVLRDAGAQNILHLREGRPSTVAPGGSQDCRDKRALRGG